MNQKADQFFDAICVYKLTTIDHKNAPVMSSISRVGVLVVLVYTKEIDYFLCHHNQLMPTKLTKQIVSDFTRQIIIKKNNNYECHPYQPAQYRFYLPFTLIQYKIDNQIPLYLLGENVTK